MKVIKLLQECTGHQNIRLTSRGNEAIFTALYIARKVNPGKVLIPDQAGWLFYRKAPKMLGMEVEELKTDFGIIELEELKRKAAGASCLIYQNPAVYFAEQPMKEIYELCKGKCLVILDASGSIGTEMCDGNYADMIVASFGKWKLADAEYGGFVSAREAALFEKPKEIFNLVQYDEGMSPRIYEKLKGASGRYEKLRRIAEKIKQELKGFALIHPDKEGINVIVRCRNEVEKREIKDYCEKHKYPFAECPRYIRVKCNALSIEVKRL